LARVLEATHAALDLRLKIAAQVFGDDAGIRECAKIRNGEVGQKGEHGGERRGGIAHKGEAHVVGLGPFAVDWRWLALREEKFSRAPWP